MKKQIIPTSAGFSIDPDNKKIDRYILDQVESECPNVCFIPTASGDAESYTERFYKHFKPENCTPSHLSLFSGETEDIEGFLMQQDVVYVGGGNTRNMLALWDLWGVSRILKNAYHQGTLLTGISAGSLCWYEQGLTDSFPGQLVPIDCLGLLEGSNCPFFDGHEEKATVYPDLIEQQKIMPGIATDIGVCLHYVDGNLHRVFAGKEGVAAYQFRRENGQVDKVELTPDIL
ncbi:MAG: peptidase E [Verrucomicrobiales bacterium]|nr:peptidase E [Verrucomicrobiales bacterium]